MIGVLATLGERLRELREARGWNTRRLATETGLSAGYLSRAAIKRSALSLDEGGRRLAARAVSPTVRPCR